MTSAELIQWFKDNSSMSNYGWTGDESVSNIKDIMDGFGLYSNQKQKQAMNNFFRGGGETTLLSDFIQPRATENIEKEIDKIRSSTVLSQLPNVVKSEYKNVIKVKTAYGRRKRILYDIELRQFAKQRGLKVIRAVDEFDKTL